MLTSLLLLATLARPSLPAPSPCTYGNGRPIPATWAEQFRCYQTTGRRIAVAGSNFDDRSSSAACIKTVTDDRFQVARCDGFGDRSSLTVAFSAVVSVDDDPDLSYVVVHLRH